MSEDIYSNELKTEIQEIDKEKMEMMVVIYESGEDFRTQTDTNTNRQQPLQSTGSKCVRMRSYRSVSVCLVLLCVLLLTAVIVLCVLINTNNQHRDQLVNKNHNLTEEKNLLLIKNINLTKENDGLLTNITNCKKQRDQLKEKLERLWEILNQTDGWIQYRFSIYLISSEKKYWTESRRYCRERGADLTIINNKEEQDFVKKISGTELIWIGLSDSDEEGRWKWVDNSTLNSRFWASGEPNGKREENCAATYNSGWYDYSCKIAYKWICELNILNEF